MMYTIVNKEDQWQLENGVRNLIEEGWEPIGGVSRSPKNYPNEPTWAQAMIKKV